MDILTDTVAIQSETIRSLRSETVLALTGTEDISYDRIANDGESLYHFNRAVQVNHDRNPMFYAAARHNATSAWGGKRRGSRSPSKAERKAAAKAVKQEKGEARSPKKAASSSSSCGPDYDVWHYGPKDEDPDPPAYPPCFSQ